MPPRRLTPLGKPSSPFSEPPLTKLEMRLRALGSEIRAKPRWWLKVHDEALVAKWRAEATAASHVSEAEFEWVLGEARWLAARAAAEPRARPSPVDGVFETDLEAGDAAL